MKQNVIVSTGKIPEGYLSEFDFLDFGSVFLGNVVGKKGYLFPDEIPEEEYLRLMEEIKEECIRHFLGGKFRLLNKRKNSGLKPAGFYEFRTKITYYRSVRESNFFPAFKEVKAFAKIYIPKINIQKIKKQTPRIPDISPDEYRKFCRENGNPNAINETALEFFDVCGERFAEELDEHLLEDAEMRRRISLYSDTASPRGEHNFSKFWARENGYTGYEGYE